MPLTDRGGVLRIAAYTGGVAVPSARFRVRQYIPALATLGVMVDERPAGLGAYPPALRVVRPIWAAASLALRLGDIAAGRTCDVTWLQREMISGYFTAERFTRSPRVLDVDDAIWIVRDGSAARKLAESCDVVICGNLYIADCFRSWRTPVVVIPTAVDTARYVPAAAPCRSDGLVIGWCGSSSGLRYLLAIEDALETVLKQHADARLRVVCDKKPSFSRVPGHRVEFIRWSASVEVEALQTMSIGLMPLEESDWCLGKCSYKMLLYMACGVPAVVTPWGMNRDVLTLGEVGFPARGAADWVSAIDSLARDPDRRRVMGSNGRQIVEREFGIARMAPQLARTLREVAAA